MTTTIARKEVEDTVRAKPFWIATAALVVLCALGLYVPGTVQDGLTANQAMRFVIGPASIVVPIVALVSSYLAICGERQSGSLRILLGQPTTRGDIFIGKYVGRTVVVAISVVAAGLVGLLVLAVGYGNVSLLDYALLIGATILLGATFVSLGITLSVLTRVRSRAIAGAVGLYLVFDVFWGVIPIGVHYLVEGTLPAVPVPAWYVFLERLSPTAAYTTVAEQLVPEMDAIRLSQDGASQAQTITLADRLGGEVPVYLGDWVSVVVLLLWLLVPLVVAYRTFTTTELTSS